MKLPFIAAPTAQRPPLQPPLSRMFSASMSRIRCVTHYVKNAAWSMWPGILAGAVVGTSNWATLLHRITLPTLTATDVWLAWEPRDLVEAEQATMREARSREAPP